MKHPILVVDDEPEILFSLRGLLRTDFEVHTAESASEALELLKQREIHVVMTDQRMPQITGVELLGQVRGEWPDAIRIVFTGYADVRAVIDAINQGHVFRYITKPWDPEELRAVLRQACEQYEQVVERKRLLSDLRAYHSLCTALLEGLREGRFGTLNAAGQKEAEHAAEAGEPLLDRLNRALASRPPEVTPP
jgi:DNA-binding NtrC family response regulator